MSELHWDWDGEPDNLAELREEMNEIAERERIESAAEEFYNNIFWSPENES